MHCKSNEKSSIACVTLAQEAATVQFVGWRDGAWCDSLALVFCPSSLTQRSRLTSLSRVSGVSQGRAFKRVFFASALTATNDCVDPSAAEICPLSMNVPHVAATLHPYVTHRHNNKSAALG